MSEIFSRRLEPQASRGSRILPIAGLILGFIGVATLTASIAYHYGVESSRPSALQDALLHATSTHGGTNAAVATGRISDDVEGLFILDYTTGNLQCWVYYTRTNRFGAKFEANVGQQLPATKNSEYLLVIGESSVVPITGNTRPSPAICYVVDTKSGMFAGYVVPWNRTMETGGQPQSGPLVCIGYDQFRAASGGVAKKAPPAAENAKEKGPGAK
jgi:hypothetical protein